MKKFLKYAFVAALVTVAGYGVYASQKSDAMSDLMLANVFSEYIRESILSPPLVDENTYR